MNRLNRLTAILVQLQSKSWVTAQEVADRFDISIRTVYRDIRALEAAGIPIGSEAGKGYFIVKGYHLPPVMFAKEEASAILLAAKLIHKQTDESVKEHFENALYKIKSVLNYKEKDFLENLDGQIAVFSPPSTTDRDTFPNNFLTTIKQALAHHKVLQFDYFANYRGDFTSREVEPLGLCYYSSHWHLIAYCRLRQAVRDFRPDRITKLSSKEEVFDPYVHKPYTEYISDMFNDHHFETVEVRFSENVARYISEQKFTYGYVSEEKKGGAVIMKFTTANLNYFARWLLMFAGDVQVISPEGLRQELKSMSRALYQAYNVS